MGQRGPAPKRATQKRRKNKTTPPDRPASPSKTVEVPAADDDWHPTARAWYESLAESGQSQFYEPSDWRAAWMLAGEMTAYLNNPRRSAMMFAQLWSGMSELLSTEGARRRVKIEVEREQPEAESEEAELANLRDLPKFIPA